MMNITMPIKNMDAARTKSPTTRLCKLLYYSWSLFYLASLLNIIKKLTHRSIIYLLGISIIPDMRQRTLVIAGLAAVGVAIAVAVPMAILAIQDSHDLRFEYVKSGGIAGINQELAFDSKAGVITFYQSTLGSTEEKRLSDAKVQELRQAVADSGFFAMDIVYPPRQGPADYFSYSLTVTMDGLTHSVSWVDDFASAQPVPTGLKNVVSEIEDAYATAQTS